MSSSRTLLGSQTYLKAKAVLVLITILAVSPAHSEQVTIPDTAAGRVLAAWLEAFNSGDQARFGIYQQKYEPAPDLSARCGDGVPRENGWIRSRRHSQE